MEIVWNQSKQASIHRFSNADWLSAILYAMILKCHFCPIIRWMMKRMHINYFKSTRPALKISPIKKRKEMKTQSTHWNILLPTVSHLIETLALAFILCVSVCKCLYHMRVVPGRQAMPYLSINKRTHTLSIEGWIISNYNLSNRFVSSFLSSLLLLSSSNVCLLLLFTLSSSFLR